MTHDPNLKRLCGVDRLVKDLEYNELPKYKKDIGVTFVPGFRLDTSPYDTRIPLLEEVSYSAAEELLNENAYAFPFSLFFFKIDCEY